MDVIPARPDLMEFDLAGLEAALAERGHERFRARQVFAWLYRRGVTDPAAMSDLPATLRTSLAQDFRISTPHLASRERSSDGTEKFLLQLNDGRHIESVFIPDTPAMTFCISTQVGCAMACAFCLTGKMGLVRNLTAGEIVGQVRQRQRVYGDWGFGAAGTRGLGITVLFAGAAIAAAGAWAARHELYGQAESTLRTEARVAYDANALYVAVRAWDTDPSKIVGILTRFDVIEYMAR